MEFNSQGFNGLRGVINDIELEVTRLTSEPLKALQDDAEFEISFESGHGNLDGSR